MVDNKSKRYKTNPEKELDVSVLKVVEPVKGRFAAAVNYVN